ncbi:MAG: hypothetical protein DRN30_01395 [Thermoplasmata archaeon]|nr:orotidine 5'-phosphate decarboxylase [Euryarchaeota archaeon]RLF66824.1 MAG: hypothetical protein DRN30_01395 [Thermoplasmata archaeon]
MRLSIVKPVLQVALDVLSIKKALEIAEKAVRGGVDWLEAGTPLIKSEGMKCVKVLRDSFKDNYIVADMKTMDTGALEAEMAIRSGANIVTVMGLAPDETIESMVEKARELNAYVMADLMNVGDIIKRGQEVESLGVDIVCLHLGIDQQRKRRIDFDMVKKLSETLEIPIAVAGGLNKETVALAVRAGAKVIIVGGAITKAEDPELATKEIKMSLEESYEES